MPTIVTTTSEETKKAGFDFGKTLQGGEFVALVGEIGSGKTTFVQGVAEALKTKASAKSPTFTIVNVYPAEHDKIKELIHIDCYRVKSPEELEQLGLEEMQRQDTVMFCEWPQMLGKENLPAYVVTFSGQGAEARSINIERAR